MIASVVEQSHSNLEHLIIEDASGNDSLAAVQAAAHDRMVVTREPDTGVYNALNKGTWHDNVFVERLWRTVKYEEVCLHAYASVPEARASIGRCLGFYNGRRPHSSLDDKTPERVYFNQPGPDAVAA